MLVSAPFKVRLRKDMDELVYEAVGLACQAPNLKYAESSRVQLYLLLTVLGPGLFIVPSMQIVKFSSTQFQVSLSSHLNTLTSRPF